MKKILISFAIAVTFAFSMIPTANSIPAKCYVNADGELVCPPPPVPHCTRVGC